MRVLMLGWEFPPFTSGGLGTACHGLTKSLCSQNVDVTFIVPKGEGDRAKTHVNLLVAEDLDRAQAGEEVSFRVKEISTLLKGYMNSEQYAKVWLEEERTRREAGEKPASQLYGKNLYEEVHRYANKARMLSQFEDFDVIHAHDWMTYPAAVQVKESTGKPLVVHIHATEFDRTSDNPNPAIYEIENTGFQSADMILAVSEWTRQKLIKHYGVDPSKVQVVHNAVEFTDDKACLPEEFPIKRKDKVVLFLGRLTIQKGPEHFLWAAKKVASVEPNVKFVVAGSGDMESRMVDEAVRLGMSDKVIFTGFLRGPDIDRAYRMADLYVMPSISEPFGITPLESLRNGTPTLISKQSGVSEVLRNCLKVDFWDIDQMANKMVSVLRYPELMEELVSNGSTEVHSFSWDIPAQKCRLAYESVLKQRVG